MDQEIILSLLYAEKGLTDEAMAQHRVESPETRETWAQLTAILTPTAEEALELAVAYGAASERDGFLNGFRLAVRILLDGTRESAAPAAMRPGE